MPCGYGVGDHRLFLVGFKTILLIETTPPKIVRSAARRLNTNIPRATDKYPDRFENNVRQHILIEHLGSVHESSFVK